MIDNNTNTRYLVLLPDNHMALSSANCDIAQVNKSIEIKDAHIELSSAARAYELVGFLGEHFFPYEPISKSIGLEFDEDVRQYLLEFLNDNLSVIVVHNQTKEIVACLALALEYDGMPEAKLPNKKIALIMEYLQHKHEDMDVYKRFKCNKSVHFAFLSTHRLHRGKGLATHALRAALLFVKELGPTPVHVYGEGTSLGSQKIGEKFECEIIHRFKNEEYEVDVIDRVNKSIEIKDAHIELSSAARAYELVGFLGEHFFPYEPISKSIGLEFNEDVRQYLLEFLNDNLSVIVVHNQTKEIVACLALALEYDGMPEAKLPNKKIALIMEYLQHKHEDMDVYKRFKCNKSVHFAFLSTHRLHRGKGLATHALRAALLFVKELGPTPVHVYGEGTSLGSQKIGEKFECEIIHRFKNEEYEVDGEVIFKNTGDVKELICYVKEMH
ncbi:unnamed protein product [Mytilus coruscus]|uniref:N-acetyltransferase domain-containing protein n=1 Tax=Mytilus coruscus TaxID=42192 RepID=A0A6J8BCP0_MYTCO|nr:unnamed protein product [Mytilus coruscus]